MIDNLLFLLILFGVALSLTYVWDIVKSRSTRSR